MGHKINPTSKVLPLTKDWRSKWFAKKDYARNLLEDLRLREAAQKKLGNGAGVAQIDIKRGRGEQIHMTIYTAKPGIIIGRSGQGIVELRNYLEKELLKIEAAIKVAIKIPKAPTYKSKNQKDASKIKIDVIEVKKPDMIAALVAQNIVSQIERRIGHRRAIKMAIERAMQAGAKGAKVMISGRLGGAEIARKEKYSQGSVPLSNLRAEIDFAKWEAFTTYGVIGVQVWIYKGEREDVDTA